MSSAPLAPHLRIFAPDFARRFALITADLAAAIARVFLRDPRLVLFIIPLYTRLTRASRRCTSLMALLATGKTSGQHQPGRSGPHAPTTRVTTPRIPTADAWLIETLRHEAANYASQLAHLLAEPAAAELLAAAPAVDQILRPIYRLLGLRREAQRSGVDSDRGAPLPATATRSRCDSWAPQKRSLPPCENSALREASLLPSEWPLPPPSCGSRHVPMSDFPGFPDTQRSGVASKATVAPPCQRQQRSRVARAGRPESDLARPRNAPDPARSPASILLR